MRTKDNKISKAQKELISLLSNFSITLNKKIITKTGGALGEVNKGNLDFAIWRSIVETDKSKDKDKVFTFVSNLLRWIAVSHPFKDGNKRTAYTLVRIILLFSDFHLRVPYKGTVDFIINIARGSKSVDEIKVWIKKHTSKIDKPEVVEEAEEFLDSLLKLLEEK